MSDEKENKKEDSKNQKIDWGKKLRQINNFSKSGYNKAKNTLKKIRDVKENYGTIDIDGVKKDIYNQSFHLGFMSYIIIFILNFSLYYIGPFLSIFSIDFIKNILKRFKLEFLDIFVDFFEILFLPFNEFIFRISSFVWNLLEVIFILEINPVNKALSTILIFSSIYLITFLIIKKTFFKNETNGLRLRSATFTFGFFLIYSIYYSNPTFYEVVIFEFYSQISSSYLFKFIFHKIIIIYLIFLYFYIWINLFLKLMKNFRLDNYIDELEGMIFDTLKSLVSVISFSISIFSTIFLTISIFLVSFSNTTYEENLSGDQVILIEDSKENRRSFYNCIFDTVFDFEKCSEEQEEYLEKDREKELNKVDKVEIYSIKKNDDIFISDFNDIPFSFNLENLGENFKINSYDCYYKIDGEKKQFYRSNLNLENEISINPSCKGLKNILKKETSNVELIISFNLTLKSELAVPIKVVKNNYELKNQNFNEYCNLNYLDLKEKYTDDIKQKVIGSIDLSLSKEVLEGIYIFIIENERSDKYLCFLNNNPRVSFLNKANTLGIRKSIESIQIKTPSFLKVEEKILKIFENIKDYEVENSDLPIGLDIKDKNIILNDVKTDNQIYLYFLKMHITTNNMKQFSRKINYKNNDIDLKENTINDNQNDDGSQIKITQ